MKVSYESGRAKQPPEEKKNLTWDECEISGLPQITCAHCTGDSLGDENVPIEYEVARFFTATHSGTCMIDETHRIRRGDIIGKLQIADNPMVPVFGWACKSCAKNYPRASK